MKDIPIGPAYGTCHARDKGNTKESTCVKNETSLQSNLDDLSTSISKLDALSRNLREQLHPFLCPAEPILSEDCSGECNENYPNSFYSPVVEEIRAHKHGINNIISVVVDTLERLQDW